MRWTEHILRVLAFCGVIFATSQCDVHQFPGENPVDPTLVNTTIRILPCEDLCPYNPDYTESSHITESYNINGKDKFKARYLLEIYVDESFNKSLVYSETIVKDIDDTDEVIARTLTLHALHYKVLVWQDIVSADDTSKDLNYDTANLTSIKVWEADAYNGISDYKLAQTTNETFDLSKYAFQWNIEETIDIQLIRPQAKYILITTDLHKFATSHGDISKLDNCRIRISYNGFMPTGYNASSGLLNDAKGGYGYDGDILILNDKEAIIAFDYTLVGPSDTSVNLKMEIFDDKGELLNTVNSVRVPLSRNKFTIVKKEFLTKEYGGGVGIDSEFDGEYIIYV